MGVVRLECHECGGADCILTGEEVAESWIVCRSCGANLITFGQLHAEIARQARNFATMSIRSALGLADWVQDNEGPIAARSIK